MFNQAVHDRYGNVIRSVAARIYRSTFPGEYQPSDVEAMALAIAAERYRYWDAGDFTPRTDLGMRLRRAIRDDRYARGWRQKTVNGKRRWLKAFESVAGGVIVPLDDELPHGDDEKRSADKDPRLADWSWEPASALGLNEPDDIERVAFKLTEDLLWMNARESRRFAHILRRRYPVLCSEALTMYDARKPAHMDWRGWYRSRENARRRFQRKYARELFGAYLEAIEEPRPRRRAA